MALQTPCLECAGDGFAEFVEIDAGAAHHRIVRDDTRHADDRDFIRRLQIFAQPRNVFEIFRPAAFFVFGVVAHKATLANRRPVPQDGIGGMRISAGFLM